MIGKKRLELQLDLFMSVALVFLMAYPVTGDRYHEWIGAGMLLLFLAHNALHIRWYQSLLKGRYSFLRGLRTIVNLLVLIAIVLTGYSGIVMSRFVFDFLPISGGMSTARSLHLAGSYWAFVLMSFHLGMHWNLVLGKWREKNPSKAVEGTATMSMWQSLLPWLLRLVALLIAGYGAVLFGQNEIYSNMFLQNEFAILDYETPGPLVLLQNLAMMVTWILVGHFMTSGMTKVLLTGGKKTEKTTASGKVQGFSYMAVAMAVILCSVVYTPNATDSSAWQGTFVSSQTEVESQTETEPEQDETVVSALTAAEDFLYLTGGTFEMGSPETENWRSDDETQHTVTVSDFYMSAYELTQEEYASVMGENPSTFSGDALPVETISWLDAVQYCNARSQQEGLTPAYRVDGTAVTWDRGADGYRLPTEAEWEYACRAGTTTPFNTETSISAEEANYYGHYPYDIEENYFEQDNLTTRPGRYRETTVPVDSFDPNGWGLYNMHGNVSEWVWDYYGDYGTEAVTNPTGSASGTLRVYRGGGWNDFAKNMRSGYRATLEEGMGSFNIGIRLVRNAFSGSEDLVGAAVAQRPERTEATGTGKTLIAYFSWGGNTAGIAEEIQAQTGADLFEIRLTEPYSSDYNTVLDQAQRDQNIQARPEIAGHVDDMDSYDVVLIGYPNWWASIPMPIASFLEEYDFSGKTIIPFCSHGGGRFGQSLTAIAKLAPEATMGEGLSIHYSGGSSLSSDVEAWLRTNGVIE